MKCTVCKQGEIREGKTTVTLERSGAAFIVQNVPARVCVTCGEGFVSEEAAERLLEIAHASLREGVKLNIREYKAA